MNDEWRQVPGSIDELIFCGKKTIHKIITDWEKTISYCSNYPDNWSRRQVLLMKQKLHFLISLELLAEEKPLLPSYREGRHFKEGDEVICYVGNSDLFNSTKIFEKGIIFKTVGFRAFAVRLDSRADEPYGFGLDGYGMDYDATWPGLMSLNDFTYLKDNLDFASIWVHVGDSKRNPHECDAQKFIEALHVKVLQNV